MKLSNHSAHCAQWLGLCLAMLQMLPAGANEPSFVPIADSSWQFADPKNADLLLRDAARQPTPNDEGLLTGGTIRDFLYDRPYSRRPVDVMEQAWTMPVVINFVDLYGLYDLAPLADRKVISLSKQPIAELGLDGIVNLIEAAHYYSKTGRRQQGDAIFTNLTANLWPTYAPKDLSIHVLFAYAKYLEDNGEASKAKTVRDAYVAMSADKNNPNGTYPNYYSDEHWLPCKTDWQAAAKAYRAIEAHDFAEADKQIDALFENEKGCASHEPASISRLIQLARAYSRQGKTGDAQIILKQLVPLTDADALLNARMYVLAELYVLEDANTPEAHNYWNQLDAATNRIDRMWPPGKHPYVGVSLIREERIVLLMNNLALAYARNNEPAKALSILKNALANYPATQYRMDELWAELGLFAAQTGDFTAMTDYFTKSFRLGQMLSGQNLDVAAKTIDVCSRAGKPAEGEKLAKYAIDACTQNSHSPAQKMDYGKAEITPQQIIENEAQSLRAELSPIRFKYGELLIREQRFVEAEETLKLLEQNGAPLVTDELQQCAIDLGLALEGQNKYSEALAVYANLQKRNDDTLPAFQQVLNLVARAPDFGEADQQKIIEFSRHTGQYSYGKYMAKSMEQLIAMCRAQKWSEANLNDLQGQLDRYYTVEGKVDLDKATAERQQMLEGLKAALNSIDLAGLKQCKSDIQQEKQFLHLAEFEQEEQFGHAEKILKLYIEHMRSSPESWDKNALVEKCLLTDFYVQRKRFSEAKALGQVIANGLMNDPRPFIRAYEQSEGAYSLGTSDIEPAETICLRQLAQSLIEAGRADDAEDLALSTLEAEKKWTGSKSRAVYETYQLLVLAANASKRAEKVKSYHNQVVSLEYWRLGPPATRGQPNALPPELYPQPYLDTYLSGWAKPSWDEDDLARKKYQLQSALDCHGEGSPEFYVALSHLISHYWHTNRYDDAQKLLLRKMQIIESIEGRCGNHRSMCLAELASVEVSRHNKIRAKELLVLARGASIALGKTESAELLVGYAAIEYKLGEKERALATARKAFEGNANNWVGCSSSPIFRVGAQILANTDLAIKAENLVPHGFCMSLPPPDTGLFEIQ